MSARNWKWLYLVTLVWCAVFLAADLLWLYFEPGMRTPRTLVLAFFNAVMNACSAFRLGRITREVPNG